MKDFFFPKNKCGIGNTVEKPVFKFVSDCNIEPTPKPIFDCPLPVIAREPEIPCPEFNVKSKLDVGFSSGPDSLVKNCGVENKIKFEIKKKADDSCPTSSNCEFDVNLEVAVAIPAPPCPTLKVGDFNVRSGFSDQPCVEDSSRFEVRTKRVPGQKCDDPGSCEFEVDLDIIVPIPRPPCPEINVNTFSVRSDYVDNCGRGQNRFEITPRHRAPSSCNDTGDCKFDVDLELYIPIPRPPCPEILVTSFSVSSGFESENCPIKDNKFEIRRRHTPAPCDDPLQQEACDFEVDLQIFIPIPRPPCPTFNIDTFEVRSGYANSPCVGSGNRFTIIKRDIPPDCASPNICDFDVELVVNIPIPQPPCPVFDVTTFSVTSDYSNCAQGQNRFVIRPNHRPPANCTDDAGECRFDVELEINVPLPEPPCPEIRVSGFQVRPLYPICILPTPVPDKLCGCQNKFAITKTPRPLVCGDLTPPGCDFDVELSICIPPPKIPCPDIRVTTFEVKSDYASCLKSSGGGGNKFTVTRRIIPCTCDELERCEFDIDVEILVPLPEPPCPEIRVSGFQVRPLYPICILPTPVPDKLCGCQNKFTIKKTPKPIVCGDLQPAGCDFDVELSICIPPPKIPCPDIRVTKFEVKSDYASCLKSSGTTVRNRFDIARRIIPCKCDELERCEFDVELEILVPLPEPPCPEIRVTKFEVKSHLQSCQPGTNNNLFVITRRPRPPDCGDLTPPGCDFEVELEIDVPLPDPPCPEILVKSFSVTPQYPVCPTAAQCGNGSKFVITPKPVPCDLSPTGQAECNFEVELEIEIPHPKIECPTFNVKNFTVKSDYKKCLTGKNKFVIEPRVYPCDCDQPERCEFDIWLEIEVPFPEPVCPDIKSKLTVLNPVYNAITGKLPPCKNSFTVRRTPKPVVCNPGNQNPNDPQECEFTLELELCIPVPEVPCPKINVRTFKTLTKYAPCVPPLPSIFKITPDPAAAANGVCEFNVDLELYIPIPPPRCPFFGTRTGINTFLYGCGTPSITFEVTPDPIPPTCDDPGVCQFLFELLIDLPLPRFVSDLAFTQNLPPKINFDWCPQPPRDSSFKLNFVRQQNLWAGMCDRGDLVWYDVQVELDLVLGKYPPCEFIKLKPSKTEFPIKRVCNNTQNPSPGGLDEFCRLMIVSKPKARDCDPCEYEFDIEINLKTPCKLELVGNAGEVITGDCYDSTYQNTAQPPSPNPNSPAPTSGGVIWLDIEREKTCDSDPECIDKYVFTPRIELPPPKLKFKTKQNTPAPCEYSTKKAYDSCKTKSQASDTPLIKIEITPDPDATCTWEIAITPNLPTYVPSVACDKFEMATSGITVSYTTTDPPEKPKLKIEAKQRKDDDEYCTYEISGDIKIPVKCPEIKQASSFEVETVVWPDNDDMPPSITFTPELKDGNCKIEMGGKIYMPMPIKLKIGQQKFEWYDVPHGECDPQPKIDIKVSAPDPNTGEQTIDFDLQIPYPELTAYKLESIFNTVAPDRIKIKDSSDNDIGTIRLSFDPDGRSGPCDYRKAWGFSLRSKLEGKLNTTSCPTSPTSQPFTMPLTAQDGDTAAAQPSCDIMSLWAQPTFVDGFIEAVETNTRLRDAIKALLKE